MTTDDAGQRPRPEGEWEPPGELRSVEREIAEREPTQVPFVDVDTAWSRAWDTLDDLTQQWLGEDGFDELCRWLARGKRLRHVYRSKARGEHEPGPLARLASHGRKRGELFRRLKDAVAAPEVRDYIYAVRLGKVPSWSDYLDEQRGAAQDVVRGVMQDYLADPSAAKGQVAIRAALRFLDQDLPKPTAGSGDGPPQRPPRHGGDGDRRGGLADELRDFVGAVREAHSVLPTPARGPGDGADEPAVEVSVVDEDQRGS